MLGVTAVEHVCSTGEGRHRLDVNDMATGSTLAVSAAIIGNFVVMCSKFVAYWVTGSGAMLSEGIHSAADVLNQSLILLGLWLSSRTADAERPYGYHGDRFIWSLISAVGVFFLGCGVTAYHAIHSIMVPPVVTASIWAYVVLGVSLLIEGAVFLIALRAFLQACGDRPKFRFFFREADPPQVAVLLEDGVAVTGIMLAAVAIALTNVTGEPIWDSIGALLIALLLGGVAAILVAQNRRLLLGTAVPPRVRESVLRVLKEHPSVEAVFDFKSRMLSVDSYRVKMEVEFDGRAIARKMEDLLREAYPTIDSYEQFATFCESFAEQVIDALGDEIDLLEEEIRAKVPQIQHVDIEAD
ncbi:MAG: cation diffusion facilitator family transporter [Deltaproteobacteria bacterium]|nr:cation diffusion facilitator family transporter [Deltaproteobacteria bacterium]